MNISIDRKGIDSKEEWSKKGTSTLVIHMCRLLLYHMTKVPYAATTGASISLSEIYRCVTLLDTSHITKHPFHVPNIINNYTTVSSLLQPANQVYYTPCFQMMYLDLNLEDKVLYAGVLL